MRQPRNWTAEDAALIQTRRLEKLPWTAIAAEFDCAKHALKKFAKANGLWDAPLPSLRIGGGAAEMFDPNRPPYPPGHPHTWEPITRGTLLHGMEYPLP